VDVRAGDSFEVGVPRLLFKTRFIDTGARGWRWAVTRDGQRFLVITPTRTQTAGHIVVATSWNARLGRR